MSDELNENKIPEEENILDRESVLNPSPSKKKQRNIFGLVLMGLAVVALLFIFKGEDKPKEGLDKEPVPFEPAAQRPVVIPEAPPVIEDRNDEDESLKQARMKSALLIYGGNGSSNTASPSKNGMKQNENSDPNARFQENIGTTERVQATAIGSLDKIILQGKLIDAVLETAISSDLPGMVRAIVSHDIYSESGEAVLVPKGSKLLGQYNSEVRKGQSRVFVVWTRLVRPDGLEVALNSGGTDSLGRAGISGKVNHHFWQMFGTSMLLSIIGAGTANAGVSTMDPYNSTAAYRQQISEAFQNSANQALADNINIPPTINVKHGSLIKVFVARDLDFSDALSSLPTSDVVFVQ